MTINLNQIVLHCGDELVMEKDCLILPYFSYMMTNFGGKGVYKEA